MSTMRHIALYVPEIRVAEGYYKTVFDMTLIGREAALQDGQWYTLPFEKGWADAEAAGVQLGMTALRKGDFVLALFKGNASQGQVYAIGLNMAPPEIAGVRARLPEDADILDESYNNLAFRDMFQIMWQLMVPGNEFRTAGEFANRWLQF